MIIDSCYSVHTWNTAWVNATQRWEFFNLRICRLSQFCFFLISMCFLSQFWWGELLQHHSTQSWSYDHSMTKSSSTCLRCSDEEGAPGQLLSVNNIGESTILTSDLFLTAAFGKVTILIKAQLGILLVQATNWGNEEEGNKTTSIWINLLHPKIYPFQLLSVPLALF